MPKKSAKKQPAKPKPVERYTFRRAKVIAYRFTFADESMESFLWRHLNAAYNAGLADGKKPSLLDMRGEADPALVRQFKKEKGQ